jgi:hypothetical protein
VSASGTEAGQRSRFDVASTVALVLAGVAIASDFGTFIVDTLRTSNECRSIGTVILGALTWTALVSSILAVVVGVIAVVRRSGRIGWAAAAIAVGVVAGVVWLTALNAFLCSESAA